MTSNELNDIVWRKSSFSGTNGGCVEVGWRKSSFSGTNGNCVEVGWRVEGVAVRDTKNTEPALTFPEPTWRRLLANLPG